MNFGDLARQDEFVDDPLCLVQQTLATLSCTLCSLTFKSPITLRCGCTACRTCLASNIVNTPHQCPMCGSPQSIHEGILNLSLESVIEQLLGIESLLVSQRTTVANEIEQFTKYTESASDPVQIQYSILRTESVAPNTEHLMIPEVSTIDDQLIPCTNEPTAETQIDDSNLVENTYDEYDYLHSVEGSINETPCPIQKHLVVPNSYPLLDCEDFVSMRNKVSYELSQSILKSIEPVDQSSQKLSADEWTESQIIDCRPLDGTVDINRRDESFPSLMADKQDTAKFATITRDPDISSDFPITSLRNHIINDLQSYLSPTINIENHSDVKDTEIIHDNFDIERELKPDDSIIYSSMSPEIIVIKTTEITPHKECRALPSVKSWDLDSNPVSASKDFEEILVVSHLDDHDNLATLHTLGDTEITQQHQLHECSVISQEENVESLCQGNYTTKSNPVGSIFSLEPWGYEIQQEMELMKQELRLNQNNEKYKNKCAQEELKITKDRDEVQTDVQSTQIDYVRDPSITRDNLDCDIDISTNNEYLRCSNEEALTNKIKPDKFSLDTCRIIVAAEVLSIRSIAALNRCRDLGLFEYGNLIFTDETTINVFVVEVEGPSQGDLLLCNPTVMYIKAICTGVYIVNSLWLIKMSEQARRLRPREYEISGSIFDSITGGPFRARKAFRNTMGQLRLFEDLIFILDFPSAKESSFRCFNSAAVLITEAELRWIIYFCGGSVLGSNETKSFILRGNISFLRNRSIKTSVIRLLSAHSLKKNVEVDFSFVVYRTIEWLINSVCIQKIPEVLPCINYSMRF